MGSWYIVVFFFIKYGRYGVGWGVRVRGICSLEGWVLRSGFVYSFWLCFFFEGCVRFDSVNGRFGFD